MKIKRVKIKVKWDESMRIEITNRNWDGKHEHNKFDQKSK